MTEPLTPRQELAAAQEALVRALVAGGAVPAGFDVERVQAQADALHAKRRRGIERAAPDVVATLGAQFAARFGEWARTHPPRTESGPREDARAFAAWAAHDPADTPRVRTSRRRRRPERTAKSRPERP